MPRKYVKKTNYTAPDPDDLLEMLKAIKFDKKSVLAVSKHYHMPKSNLYRIVDAFDESIGQSEVTEKKLVEFVNLRNKIGVKTIFTKEQENALMCYVLMASKINQGLTISELRTMAFEFGKREKIEMPHSWDKATMAGIDWYYGFMKRHPNISLRTPQQISVARVKGFNKESVDEYYKQLGDLYEKYSFPRDRVWNMDETGFPTVPNKVQKLLAEKGAKRVGQISAAERGTNISCAVAVSAAGTFIPPFFIFPTRYNLGRYMDGAQKESVGYANGSGYMDTERFVYFMQHFIKYAHSTKDQPTLLLLDNHTSHLSVAAVELAVEHGITMLTFPPHCTHRIQPLDNGVFWPVKARYVEKHTAWQKAHVGGKQFDLHNVPPIVEKCLDEAATPAIIKTAFSITGAFEFNAHTFTEEDFIAARVIAEAEERAQTRAEPGAEMSAEHIHQHLDRVLLVLNEDIPTGSMEEVATTSASRMSSTCVNLNAAGPLQIGQAKQKSNRGRKAMKSTVLTTPQKRSELQEAAEKRLANKRKKEGSVDKPPKKRGPGAKNTPPGKKVPSAKKTTAQKTTPAKKASKKKESSSSDEDRDFCTICLELMPNIMTKHNTISCDKKDCQRSCHLKCVNRTTSFFYCPGCDSDLDVSSENDE